MHAGKHVAGPDRGGLSAAHASAAASAATSAAASAAASASASASAAHLHHSKVSLAGAEAHLEQALLALGGVVLGARDDAAVFVHHEIGLGEAARGLLGGAVPDLGAGTDGVLAMRRHIMAREKISFVQGATQEGWRMRVQS
jgi:hypothetical protein